MAVEYLIWSREHGRWWGLGAERLGEGPLTERTAGVQPARRKCALMLRVFGRLPVSDVMRCSEAGVRKASGEETAGEFAPAVVSVYGDLAPM